MKVSLHQLRNTILFVALATASAADIRVVSVKTRSPAEAAGIKPGDTISEWQTGSAHGPIAWPLDLLLIHRERKPLSPTLTFLGTSAGKPTSWTVDNTSTGQHESPWGLTVESSSEQIKALVERNRELIKANQFQQVVDHALSESAKVNAADGMRSYLLYRAANQLAVAGQIKETSQLLAAALPQVPPSLPYFRPLIYRLWARAYLKKQDKASGFAYYEKAIHEWRTLRLWPLNLANELNALASAKNSASLFQESIALNKQSLAIRLPIAPLHESTVTVFQNLGDTYLESGDLESARQALQKGLAIMQHRKGKSATRAYLYFAMGALYHDMGSGADSEKFDLLCEDELKDLPGEEYLQADNWSNLGVLALERQNLVRAEYFLNRTLVYKTKTAPEGDATTVHLFANLGYLKFLNGDYPTAAALYQKALHLQEHIEPNNNEMVDILGNLGELMQKQGDTASAHTYYLQSLAIAEHINPRSTETAIVHHNLGSWYFQQSQFQQAEDENRKAAQLERTAEPNGIDYPQDLADLAAAEDKLGKSSQAMADYTKAFALFGARTEELGRSDSLHMRSTLADYHANFTAFLINQGYQARAFNVLDNSRARTLVLTLAGGRVNLRNSVPPALLEADRKLEAQLASLSERRTQTLAENHAANISSLDAKITAISSEHDLVENRMRIASPRYASLNRKTQPTLSRIQSLLEPGTAIIEYTLGKDHSYVLAVDRTRIASFKLAAKSEINSLARATYQNWSKRTPSTQDSINTAQKLSSLVVSPLADFLKDKHRLLIVADGMLQYVPFAALPLPIQHGVLPLAAQFEVVSLPSASLLATLRQLPKSNTPQPQSIAVISDPVFTKDDPRVTNTLAATNHPPAPPTATRSTTDEAEQYSIDTLENEARGVEFNRLTHSREEAEAIASVSPPNRLFMATDFAANRAAALQPKVTQSRIVHFATHGVFDAKNPAMSGLIFSLVDRQGNPQPGFLGLDAIYSSHFSADLVVLSACETALGEEVDGEGLVGLTWGFIYAGAKSVVASLWRVNDASTAELMRVFYDGIQRRHLLPATALRQAQLAISQKPQWSAPYYWAGFIIEGDYRR